MKPLYPRLLNSRQGGTLLLALTYLILGTLLRVGLLAVSAGVVSWGWGTWGSLVVGFAFDLVMAWFLTLPFGLLSALWPKRFSFKVLVGFWCFGSCLFVFWKIAEILFWEEFAVRFNFIAVDYLVYTTEVVKNIQESYPLPLILAGVLLLGIAWYWCWRRLGLIARWHEGFQAETSPRWVEVVALLFPLALILVTALFLGRHDLRVKEAPSNTVGECVTTGLRHMVNPQPSWANSYDTELAKNGEYSFLAAFWANQLEWNRFYPTRSHPVADLRQLLGNQGIKFATDDPRDITRTVSRSVKDQPRRLNVIQITVESLSAEFLGCYGQAPYVAQKLTPNLDRLAKESIWFRHCYASGTRTVRGMEALTLGIPPIPGQSVLRRAGCENLCTLGSILKAQGYDTAFIYGGDGFFDNMNYFFSTNGYRIVDQPAAEKKGEITTFGNAWGACDEDSFNWCLHEADRAFAAHQPFHHFVMTTSNHRPYTWPPGRIDVKLINREGGVAYTDYAIGNFLKLAASKPWFNDTIFVIVADHCASVAGKRELEIRKYEIPLFIWSPKNLAPRVVDTMMSQVDLTPTLLGLLNFNYTARFVGDDALAPTFTPRAFISNYQKVAVLQPDGVLTVLKPVRQGVQYRADLQTGELKPLGITNEMALEEAIIYYQGTDELFKRGGLTNPSR